MSYKQAMKWQATHPRGTRQPMLFSTGSGFWPAKAWLDDNYFPYVKACTAAGVEPMEQERFYRITTSKTHFPRTPENYAAMTAAGTLGT